MIARGHSIAAWPRAVLLVLALLAGRAADAAVFSVTASGPVLYTVVDTAGLLPFDPPASGTLLTLTFTFDDSVPEQVGGANTARYVDGVSALQLLVGTTAYTLPSGAASIFIGNDWASIVILPPGLIPQRYDDTWQARQTAFRPGGTIEESLTLFLLNSSRTLPVSPLDSTALLPPPSLAGWPLAQIIFRVEDAMAPRPGRFVEITADVTELTVTPVPVPGGAGLLLAALALAGVRLRAREAA
jgi:hypothetical protein